MSDRNDLDQKIEGRTEQASGEAKEDVGKTLGNEALVKEGRAEQASGEIREGVADAEQTVDRAADHAREALDGK